MGNNYEQWIVWAIYKFIIWDKNRIDINLYASKKIHIDYEKDTYNIPQSSVDGSLNDGLYDIMDSNKSLFLNRMKIENYK